MYSATVLLQRLNVGVGITKDRRIRDPSRKLCLLRLQRSELPSNVRCPQRLASRHPGMRSVRLDDDVKCKHFGVPMRSVTPRIAAFECALHHAHSPKTVQAGMERVNVTRGMLQWFRVPQHAPSPRHCTIDVRGGWSTASRPLPRKTVERRESTFVVLPQDGGSV